MKNILFIIILISHSIFCQSNLEVFFSDTSKNCYSVGYGESQTEAIINSIININSCLGTESIGNSIGNINLKYVDETYSNNKLTSIKENKLLRISLNNTDKKFLHEIYSNKQTKIGENDSIFNDNYTFYNQVVKKEYLGNINHKDLKDELKKYGFDIEIFFQNGCFAFININKELIKSEIDEENKTSQLKDIIQQYKNKSLLNEQKEIGEKDEKLKADYNKEKFIEEFNKEMEKLENDTILNP